MARTLTGTVTFYGAPVVGAVLNLNGTDTATTNASGVYTFTTGVLSAGNSLNLTPFYGSYYYLWTATWSAGTGGGIGSRATVECPGASETATCSFEVQCGNLIPGCASPSYDIPPVSPPIPTPPPVPYVPPAVPPTPGEDCCPTLWWCDGEGNVVSGRQRPSEDYTGPWRTEAEALSNCPTPPPPPVGVTCRNGEIVNVPGRYYVTVSDPTGDFVGLFPFNSVAVDMAVDGRMCDGIPAYSVAAGGVIVADNNGVEWNALVEVGCDHCVGDASACSDSPQQVKVYVSFAPVLQPTPPYMCNGLTDYSTIVSGDWLSTDNLGFYHCRPSSGPFVDAGGETAGTFVTACPGLIGSFAVNLSE